MSVLNFSKLGEIVSDGNLRKSKIYLRSHNLEKSFSEQQIKSNLKRTLFLSGFAFFMLLYVSIMDYISMYSSQNEASIDIYRILDPLYVIFVLIINILARFAKTYDSYKMMSRVVNVFFTGTIINFALISSIEQFDFNHHPSFIFAITIMAILLHVRPYKILIMFGTGLLIISTFHTIIGFQGVVADISYSVTLFMGPVAIVVSYLNYTNSLNSFVDRHRLSRVNKHLESQVEARTQDLKDTNEELKTQIENQQKFEQNLKAAILKAERSDRLKSAFLSNLSHEIRTPLNSIIGFSSLLNNPKLNEDKIQRYTNLITNCGKELVFIIDQLVEVSRIESGEIEVNKLYFMLNEVMYELQEQTLSRLRELSKDNIKLSIQNRCHDRNLRVYGDLLKLKHVLENLIENAIKFTEEGKIEIGVELESNKTLYFYVKDTGIGISEKDKEILFDQFSQGESGISRRYGGLGLGLSISKTYVELMQGKIWFDSQEGKGTSFYMSLPI